MVREAQLQRYEEVHTTSPTALLLRASCARLGPFDIAGSSQVLPPHAKRLIHIVLYLQVTHVPHPLPLIHMSTSTEHRPCHVSPAPPTLPAPAPTFHALSADTTPPRAPYVRSAPRPTTPAPLPTPARRFSAYPARRGTSPARHAPLRVRSITLPPAPVRTPSSSPRNSAQPRPALRSSQSFEARSWSY
ncbi:hypothetical protein DFH09DRAFT_126967 [Mycena vulgaris]|nr:hypothetical protein DFH09DRAFT_126967 [Mycena vulgaris]